VTGTEDAPVAFAGLSAALVDTDGSEKLSVKISGLPFGSQLSAGSNNGDGSWTIPVASLATLTLVPPAHYSGVMSLELQAFALDANGTTATTTVPFTVTISPVADTVSLAPQNVTGGENAPLPLDLRLALGDVTGTTPGENPAEQVELTFAGLPPAALLSAAGGTLVALGGGGWRFTGTVAQAATLAFEAVNTSGVHAITVDAVAIDGASRSATVSAGFTITSTPQADAPSLLVTDMAGAAGTTIPINIAVALVDTDGSETLGLVRLAGVPATAAFSVGVDEGGGVWAFTPAQLPGLTLTLPAGQTSFAMAVTATASDLGQPVPATTSGTINVSIGPGGVMIAGDGVNNVLRGSAGADTIDGGPGLDVLTGGAGADRFVWTPDDLGSTDVITDFATASGDALDLSALLNGYVAGSALDGFVSLVTSGADTEVRIDRDGGSSFATSLALLQGVTGLNVETLRANGHLIG
jgi:Ca2+-binding RTX toxin-like protein